MYTHFIRDSYWLRILNIYNSSISFLHLSFNYNTCIIISITCNFVPPLVHRFNWSHACKHKHLFLHKPSKWCTWWTNSIHCSQVLKQYWIVNHWCHTTESYRYTTLNHYHAGQQQQPQQPFAGGKKSFCMHEFT